MAAPPVQALDGMFHSRVVIEASASPARFSRTFIAASKQRTMTRPPYAPPTRECTRAIGLLTRKPPDGCG